MFKIMRWFFFLWHSSLVIETCFFVDRFDHFFVIKFRLRKRMQYVRKCKQESLMGYWSWWVQMQLGPFHLLYCWFDDVLPSHSWSFNPKILSLDLLFLNITTYPRSGCETRLRVHSHVGDPIRCKKLTPLVATVCGQSNLLWIYYMF